MPQPRYTLTFVQITGVGDQLFGLDQEGGVWRYVAAKENSYAFWTRLTSHGRNPADRPTIERNSND